MRRGDFHLRRDDRQMFANYVVLSQGGGSDVPGLEHTRRTAGFVETPVYDVPKLWWLSLDFQGVATPGPLTPWVPASIGFPNVIRVTVRQALDRDKWTTDEQFDLTGITTAVNATNALPKQLFEGHQIGVKVEMLGSTALAPIGVQVSLVEVTADERDPYRNTTIASFAQSGTSAIFLQPNPRRRQFFVQNWGTSPLYVAFSYFAVAPGVGARWTMALPNRGDIYESPRDAWQGHVSGVWAGAGGAADVAMVTEGF